MESPMKNVPKTGAPDASTVEALLAARHPDPFGVLGLHSDGPAHWAVRALLPGVQSVDAVGEDGRVLAALHAHADGPLWFGLIPRATPAAPVPAYRLRVSWGTGHEQILEDAYRFPTELREADRWLIGEGTHLRPYEVLGAHPLDAGGVAGVRFAVWAPNAKRVSVVAVSLKKDGRRHMMRRHPGLGVWEIFVPHVAEGDRYKYELVGADGVLRLKADPYATRAELRPATASIVQRLPAGVATSDARRQANALGAPISIYEVHAASWRRHSDGGWLSWDELAVHLLGYVRNQGFTHVELLPIQEYPFDGSWGYQPIGLYAPTARHGDPEGFRRFVQTAHDMGLGVFIDWVPAHFPSDEHGLALFDGTALYEHADPREGFHPDWNTLIYNYGRTEVRNFLIGNALYWIERFGVDGLRVDAVASMLYRDYSRRDGEWLPNRYGGRENLEAIEFMRRMNRTIGVERPEAVMIAEESTSFPGVTRPPSDDLHSGGLGFHYKWNMGWMNDTLGYIARNPIHRKWHHDQLRFSLVYAFHENFVLPLSHDEVVHGKGSMIGKMPGDDWQRFANLRAYYGYQWGHPGKKLLFMGCEFAQWSEWNADESLPWHLLEHAPHAGVQRLVRDLNNTLRYFPALHTQDVQQAGFQWLRHDDVDQALISFVRWGSDGSCVVVICHFTPVVRHGHRVGVPFPGPWREVINTDLGIYGGSNVDTGVQSADDQPWDGQPHSLTLRLPPLATVMLVPDDGTVPDLGGG